MLLRSAFRMHSGGTVVMGALGHCSNWTRHHVAVHAERRTQQHDVLSNYYSAPTPTQIDICRLLIRQLVFDYSSSARHHVAVHAERTLNSLRMNQ